MALVLSFATTFAKDLSVYKHSVNWHGDTIIGKHAQFDGNDYGNIDSVVPTVSSDTVGTWIAWVKIPDANPATTNHFLSFGDTDANEVISLGFQNVSGNIYAVAANDWAYRADQASVDNMWICIALTHNGTRPHLYKNGVQTGGTFITNNDRTTWFSDFTGIDNGRIGCQNFFTFGNITFFTGHIGILKMYNDLKTEDYIDYFYHSTRKYF